MKQIRESAAGLEFMKMEIKWLRTDRRNLNDEIKDVVIKIDLIESKNFYEIDWRFEEYFDVLTEYRKLRAEIIRVDFEISIAKNDIQFLTKLLGDSE